jgi:ribosomal protein L11 methyltransferase
MPQIRLFVSASEQAAGRMLDLMERAFEDDGHALTSSEVDEDNDIWEASIYVDGDLEDNIRARLSACLEKEFGRVDILREALPEIDWVAKSLEGLKPVRAGRFLVHGSHDRARVRPGDVAIEIDAGQAFGTGHHGTTAGCLEMIERVMRRRRVSAALDLGTGSGVLAIAVRKLQPARILATDIDPVAIRVARENARRNAAADIEFVTAAGFHAEAIARRAPFDLIVANILARPLMKMAPEIVGSLAQGGEVILSGILAEQRWKVLAAFNGQRLAHRATIWKEGWVTLHLA